MITMVIMIMLTVKLLYVIDVATACSYVQHDLLTLKVIPMGSPQRVCQVGVG